MQNCVDICVSMCVRLFSVCEGLCNWCEGLFGIITLLSHYLHALSWKRIILLTNMTPSIAVSEIPLLIPHFNITQKSQWMNNSVLPILYVLDMDIDRPLFMKNGWLPREPEFLSRHGIHNFGRKCTSFLPTTPNYLQENLRESLMNTITWNKL